MKVGIIGNYGNNNNGDEAILCGLLDQLTVYLNIPKENLVVFSNNPKDTMLRYSVQSVPLLHKKSNILLTLVSTYKAAYQVMKKLDLVIIGGGGLLMDMYKRDAPLYSTLGKAAKKAGCKLVILGVGAGPIQTKLGSILLRNLVQSADQVSVRDEKSKHVLRGIGVAKDISVIGDPALLIKYDNTHSSQGILKIGVTAVPYFSSDYWPVSMPEVYEAYLSGMASNLNRLLTKKNIHLTLFSTKYPQDVTVTEDLLERLTNKENVTLISDNLHPNELLKVIGEQDLLIGTRLHSLILATVTETPIIGIAYHEKVKQFMKLLGQEGYLIEIDDLSQSNDILDDYVSSIDSQYSDFIDQYTQATSQLKEKAWLGVEQLAKVTGLPIYKQ